MTLKNHDLEVTCDSPLWKNKVTLVNDFSVDPIHDLPLSKNKVTLRERILRRFSRITTWGLCQSDGSRPRGYVSLTLKRILFFVM